MDHLNKTELQKLQARIEHEIPISKALGVQVTELSDDHVVLKAPLSLNINHQSTAFGGSVNSVAVLSCWALVTTALARSPFEVGYIVVQNSQIDYQKPIDYDFEAQATWIDENEKERFFKMLQRKGLARVSLKSVVQSKGKTAAILKGRFVAHVANSVVITPPAKSEKPAAVS